MGGLFASAVAWLLSKSTGDVIGKIVDRLTRTDDGTVKLEDIRARSAEALAKEDTTQRLAAIDAGNARQATKMNQPVFWIIICVMMGPPALILWGVAIYNVLFWDHGIWPQPWAIADFPASIKPWVEKSIDWLYDPIGAPSTVGAAALASWLAHR